MASQSDALRLMLAAIAAIAAIAAMRPAIARKTYRH